jgi:hypothetical protein
MKTASNSNSSSVLHRQYTYFVACICSICVTEVCAKSLWESIALKFGTCSLMIIKTLPLNHPSRFESTDSPTIWARQAPPPLPRRPRRAPTRPPDSPNLPYAFLSRTRHAFIVRADTLAFRRLIFYLVPSSDPSAPKFRNLEAFAALIQAASTLHAMDERFQFNSARNITMGKIFRWNQKLRCPSFNLSNPRSWL